MRNLFWLIAAGGSVLCLGCGAREHLDADHGKLTRERLSAQQVSKKPATGSPLGLDSEEASVIRANYSKSLATKGQSTGPESGSRVLLLRTGATEQVQPN